MSLPPAALLRALVLAYWFFGTVDVLTSLLFPELLPAPLAAYMARDTGPGEALVLAWMGVLLLALIIGSLGVFRLQVWGRWLFLVANLLMFASYPLLDAMVYSWLGGLCADLALTATGGILVLSFLPGVMTAGPDQRG